MNRALADCLPRSYEAGPVEVRIGGASAPPSPEPYRIEITDTSKLIPIEPVDEGPSEILSTGKQPHMISLDSVTSLYESFGNERGGDPFCEEADNSSDPAGNAEKPKRKKEKRSKDDINREFLDALWGSASDKEDDPAVPAEEGTPKNSKTLGEYDLHRILTNAYTFGCYGSSLYVRNFDGVYSEVNTFTIQKLLMHTLTEEQQRGFLIGRSSAVRDRLLAAPEVTANKLVFPKTKVLFANGCWDIVDKVPAQQLDSDFFVTRINARYLPFKKLECPNFDDYLETSSGGDESIKARICAMLGYLLLPGYPGKKILVLGTAKNSGKSMISRFYQYLVGPELVCGQTPFDMKESHALSEFSGKIANMAMDLPATTIKPASVGVMKALSGGDVISVNPKGKDRRSQICFTKQVLGTNAPLKLQQYDEAFWERVEIIPYMYSVKPDDRILDLEEMLMLERDDIVTKCMKAARRLFEARYRFPDCPAADEMKSEWIGWKAGAKVFLNTHCVAEKGSFTPSTALYEKYLQHCQDNALAYGSMTGFITLAKQMFPSNGNPHPMIDGVQLRGLPDVRYLGEN